jgi:hypothetical protein
MPLIIIIKVLTELPSTFDLDSKLCAYLSDIKGKYPQSQHRHEIISDYIIDLRNDIGHGEARRNETNMYSIYLIAKIIALNMLLEELYITDVDRKSIIDNL